jgi:hypothetical protein
MAASKVVENAVLEYTGKDDSTHAEQKSEKNHSQSEKRNKQRAISTEFDPATYDPNEKRDGYLSKTELNKLITLDEPVINPDHVNWKSLFRDVRKNSALLSGPKYINWNSRLQDADKKSLLLAGVCRFENTETITEYDIQEAITTYLGDSTYILNQYTKTIPEEFVPKPSVIFDRDSEEYESQTVSYFPTTRHQKSYYQDRYETIKQAVDTPVDELPAFGSHTEPYEYLRQWLDQQQVSESLAAFDIANNQEIETVKQDLLSHQETIDECLTAIEAGTDPTDFTRAEAIDALPYDQEQSERLVSLLIEIGYIGDWNSQNKALGINENRLVWRE